MHEVYLVSTSTAQLLLHYHHQSHLITNYTTPDNNNSTSTTLSDSDQNSPRHTSFTRLLQIHSAIQTLNPNSTTTDSSMRSSGFVSSSYNVDLHLASYTFYTLPAYDCWLCSIRYHPHETTTANTSPLLLTYLIQNLLSFYLGPIFPRISTSNNNSTANNNNNNNNDSATYPQLTPTALSSTYSSTIKSLSSLLYSYFHFCAHALPFDPYYFYSYKLSSNQLRDGLDQALIRLVNSTNKSTVRVDKTTLHGACLLHCNSNDHSAGGSDTLYEVSVIHSKFNAEVTNQIVKHVQFTRQNYSGMNTNKKLQPTNTNTEADTNTHTTATAPTSISSTITTFTASPQPRYSMTPIFSSQHHQWQTMIIHPIQSCFLAVFSDLITNNQQQTAIIDAIQQWEDDLLDEINFNFNSCNSSSSSRGSISEFDFIAEHRFLPLSQYCLPLPTNHTSTNTIFTTTTPNINSFNSFSSLNLYSSVAPQLLDFIYLDHKSFIQIKPKIIHSNVGSKNSNNIAAIFHHFYLKSGLSSTHATTCPTSTDTNTAISTTNTPNTNTIYPSGMFTGRIQYFSLFESNYCFVARCGLQFNCYQLYSDITNASKNPTGSSLESLSQSLVESIRFHHRDVL